MITVYASDRMSVDAAVLRPASAPLWRLVPAAEPPTALAEPALWLDDAGLWLLSLDGRPNRLEAQDIRQRLQGPNLLARACGVRAGGPRRRILDPMAGWGLDALVLRELAAEVTLGEQHPVAYLLLRELLDRLDCTEVPLHFADGWNLLTAHDAGNASPAFDVVYLDPMFPERGKTALPRQRLQLLAALTSPDPRPLTDWLNAAAHAAGDRVVLKRRARDPVTGRPDWQLRGRSVRFDVYRCHSLLSAQARSTA